MPNLHWRVKKTMMWVNGTLPVPVVSGGGLELLLAPCKPEKQPDYPGLIGYLKLGKWPSIRQIEMQVWVDPQHDNTYIIHDLPDVFNKKIVYEGVLKLIKMAEKHGHVFPTRDTPVPTSL
jgi:hypothetical protein